MSADFLAKIAAEKRENLKAKAAYYENLKRNLKPRDRQRYGIFKKAVGRAGQVNLIAEIKKASPSAGLLREDFEVRRIAGIYADNGAAAVSVLTEEKYFLGKPAYLKTVSEEFPLPTLMKDFLVHEYQVYEGAFCGASAILLIAAMLSDRQLKDLMDAGHALGMDCLVEAHDEHDIDRAVAVGAEIIGVNNRNLKDLRVDIENCLRMIPRIPKDKVVVAHCGLRTVQLHGDEDHHFCHRLRRAGIKVIKALRVGPDFNPEALKAFKVDGFLFDAFDKDVYGGSGKSFDWRILSDLKSLNVPIILSGGLNHHNVIEPVNGLRPYAVDVNSGVEEGPGKKDGKKMKDFIDVVSYISGPNVKES